MFALLSLAAVCFAHSSSPRDSDFIVGNPMNPYEQRKHKCNPVDQVRAYLDAFNENRYADLDHFYTEDAMRFTNGKLDAATQGRPITSEQFIELRTLYPLRYEARQITRSGDWAVAVTGSLLVGGAVEPARRFGWGTIFEFRHGDRCLIQVERHHYSQDSVGYERFREASCTVFEPLQKTDICSGNDEMPPEDAETPEVDLAARTREALEAYANGNAATLAGYFAPSVRVFVNSLQEDPEAQYSQAGYWSAFFATASAENVQIESLIVDGMQVQVQWSATHVIQANGERERTHYHHVLRFDAGGVVTQARSATSPTPALDLASGNGVNLDFWVNQGAAAAANAAAGTSNAPTYYTNNGFGGDFAYWGSATLRENGVPSWLSEVYAFDTDPAATGMDYLSCKAYLPIATARVDEVRSISSSLVYDQLAEDAYSSSATINGCAVDFWFAARVAQGQVTIGEATAAYAGAQASMASDPSFRERVFNELAALIG